MKRATMSGLLRRTEETTETLYLLGKEARIVGISGFTVRPSWARREKPEVSAFTSARNDRIVALEPDLVLGRHGAAGAPRPTTGTVPTPSR